MDKKQRFIAEKLVSDVMYWGQMGKLEEDTSIRIPLKSRSSCNYSYQLPEVQNPVVQPDNSFSEVTNIIPSCQSELSEYIHFTK